MRIPQNSVKNSPKWSKNTAKKRNDYLSLNTYICKTMQL